MANGLIKGDGACINEALVYIAQLLLMGGPLTPEAGWSARPLAMIVAGLGKGEGPEVEEALTGLAQALMGQELTAHNGWTVPFLVMLANGLGKRQEPAVRSALARVAQGVTQRPLTAAEGWGEAQLAIMINALAKGEGPDIRQALSHLAARVCQLPQAAIQAWPARPQAMMVHGLARGEGPEIQEALNRLAQAIIASDLTAGQGWNSRFLSMASMGLGKTSAALARPALARLADWVCQLELAHEPETAGSDLGIIMDVMGQTLADHAAFEKITAALVHRAALEPEVLNGLLGCLARFALSAVHLKSASRLLEALGTQDVRPGSERERQEMLWSITLFHFASLQHTPVDQALTVSFAQARQRYRFCTVTGWRDHDSSDDGRIDNDRSEAASSDLWHERWAADYWAPPAARGQPTPAEPAAVTPATPYWQGQVFERFRKELPGHDVRQEVRVNHFPVDIMIDGRVCIEVDGPGHFVELLAHSGGRSGVVVRQRRTKDLFIDHMLGQYGYRVVRIEVARIRDPVMLEEQVRQLVRALDSPLPEASGAGQQESQDGDTGRSARQA